MMCKWGTHRKTVLCNGEIVDHVDACIAPLVQILNDYGILTLNSCCGHGEKKESVVAISAHNIELAQIGHDFMINLKFPSQYKQGKKRKDG